LYTFGRTSRLDGPFSEVERSRLRQGRSGRELGIVAVVVFRVKKLTYLKIFYSHLFPLVPLIEVVEGNLLLWLNDFN